MDEEKVLAQKKANLEKLIQNMDKAIQNEMLKYDEAEFYIRLQSECFGLYPVVVKALSLLIANDQKRAIFCSFVKGHKLERLAAFHNLTPKEAIHMFRSTVREIRERIDNGAFTAKESVNIRLLMERNYLKEQLRNNNELYNDLLWKYQMVNEELDILQAKLSKRTEYEQSIINQKEQIIREEIRKELLVEMRQQIKMEIQAEEKTTKDSPHIPAIVQWIRCLRMIYSRL